MWLFSHLIHKIRAWHHYGSVLRELNDLDDRELADIGVARGDIHWIAWESAHH